jgi:hypothetical protein
VYGILLLNGAVAPFRYNFSSSVTVALGEYTRNQVLFHAVLEIFLQDGDIHKDRHFRADHWTGVVRALTAKGVTADDKLLPTWVRGALSTSAGLSTVDGSGAPMLNAIIDLPDLEQSVDSDIQVDNLHAMQAVYFSAMMDELRVFQVVDKLVEQAHYGLLPISKGPAGHMLYTYWKEGQNRLTEHERFNLYARTLGMPGGDVAQTNINRNFQMLWLRFLSAVSTFYRQVNVDSILRTATPMHVHQEQVRKAARDLAGNLSLYGYGVTYYAAIELQNQINQIIQLLSEPDILKTHGAQDMYQLIDQVSSLEFGGAKNSIRCRTMAQSGATIIRWLAQKVHAYSGYSTADVVNLEHLYGRHTAGRKPMMNPTDYDMVNAVEQWLAVNGIPEQQVEEYSQPFEPPAMTTMPINVPSMVRDALEPFGVQAGVNGGNGRSALLKHPYK